MSDLREKTFEGGTDSAAVATVRLPRMPVDDGSITSIRVLYADLHGIARGKDVPISEFDHALEKGLAFCSAVMGTDLRHTPVRGGEEGYPDLVARPDVSTDEAASVGAGRGCLPFGP